MPTVTSAFRTAAPPQAVWDLLGHSEAWPSWSSMKTATIVREGSPERDGVGSRRAFRTQLGTTTVEDVVVHDAPRHHAYALVSGLPLKGYRGDVTLEPTADGGTEITWTSRWDGPAPAFFWTAFVRQVQRSVGGDLAKAAAAKASAPAG